MRAARRGLVKALKGLPLDESAVDAIVRSACAGDPWVSKKFKLYLSEHITRPVTGPRLEHVVIGPDKIPAVAQAIYDMRSKLTHEAKTLPPTAAYSGGPFVGVRTHAALLAIGDDWGRDTVPPVAWFMRAVALAHRTFVSKRLGLERCPAGECAPGHDVVAETP
jgi:hypothetical protein